MQTSTSSNATASWLSVAAVGIGAFALVTTEFLPVGLLPQIARELAITEGQTGLMVTLPGLLAALTAPLALLWARNFDRRNVLCALLALLAVSNVIVALTSNLWTLLLGRALPRLPAQSGAGLGSLAHALRLRKTRVGLLAVLLIFVGQFAAYTYLSPYLINEAGMSPVSLSALLLGFGVAGFIGNLLGGWAITRSPSWTLVGTALLMGIPMTFLSGMASLTSAVVMLVVFWGVGFGLLPIAMQSWLFAMAPDRLEAMGAIFVSSAQISIGVGALAGGLVVDHLGVLSALTLGGTLAILTAGVILIGEYAAAIKVQWSPEG